MKVQQELMRHADTITTMNVYGADMIATKREANIKVVTVAVNSHVSCVAATMGVTVSLSGTAKAG